MCICVYVCMCVCVYVCMCVFVYMCMSVCMYVCMCVRVYVCLCVCVFLCTCVRVYVLHVYVCVCLYLFFCLSVYLCALWEPICMILSQSLVKDQRHRIAKCPTNTTVHAHCQVFWIVVSHAWCSVFSSSSLLSPLKIVTRQKKSVSTVTGQS